MYHAEDARVKGGMPITVEYTCYHGEFDINRICWSSKPKKGKRFGKLRQVTNKFEESLSARDWDDIYDAIREDYAEQCEAAEEYRAELRRDR